MTVIFYRRFKDLSRTDLSFWLLTLIFLGLKAVVEGDLAAVEAYKSSGGDIARQLTSDEVRLLNRPSAFDDGFTLVHLAIRFQRQDMLAVLLTEVSPCFRSYASIRLSWYQTFTG